MSILNNLFGTYNDAWKGIVMPPRQDYSIYDLGPNELCIKGNKIKRTDFRLLNKRGQTVECSYFQQTNIDHAVPCVVYLHANGCSRLEALQYLDTVLSNPVSFFCFDFSGCGKSGGIYTSLGWYEQDDLECVIQYLTNTGKVSKIAVWGRSMGAITAILYANKDPRISCYIFDSPFSKFKQLVKELAKEKASLPGFLSEGAFSIIRQTIKSKVNFDIDAIRPLKYVDKIKAPALFGAAKDDKFVLPQHTSDLYHAYAGYKQIMMFEGDHNSQRPVNWMIKVKEFLKIYLLGEVNPADAEPKSFKHLFDPIIEKTITPITEIKLDSGKKQKRLPHDPWLEHSVSSPNLPSMQIFQTLEPTERDIKGPTLNQDTSNSKNTNIFQNVKNSNAPSYHGAPKYAIETNQKTTSANSQHEKPSVVSNSSQPKSNISSQQKFAKLFSLNSAQNSSSNVSIFGTKQEKPIGNEISKNMSSQSLEPSLKDNSIQRLNSSIGFGIDQINYNKNFSSSEISTASYARSEAHFSMTQSTKDLRHLLSGTNSINSMNPLCHSRMSPEKVNSGRIFEKKKAPYNVDMATNIHVASDKVEYHRVKENVNQHSNLPKRPNILQGKMHSDNALHNSGHIPITSINSSMQNIDNGRQIDARRNTDNLIKPFANFMKEEPKEKNVNVNKSVIYDRTIPAPTYAKTQTTNRITIDLSQAGTRYVKK